MTGTSHLVAWTSPHAPRALCAEELYAINFFEKNLGGAWNLMNDLSDYYLNTICEAGPNWAQCEFTTAKLARVQNEIDELVGYWCERIRDWAGD
jgi:hypothetical protein